MKEQIGPPQLVPNQFQLNHAPRKLFLRQFHLSYQTLRRVSHSKGRSILSWTSSQLLLPNFDPSPTLKNPSSCKRGSIVPRFTTNQFALHSCQLSTSTFSTRHLRKHTCQATSRPRRRPTIASPSEIIIHPHLHSVHYHSRHVATHSTSLRGLTCRGARQDPATVGVA